MGGLVLGRVTPWQAWTSAASGCAAIGAFFGLLLLNGAADATGAWRIVVGLLFVGAAASMAVALRARRREQRVLRRS